MQHQIVSPDIRRHAVLIHCRFHGRQGDWGTDDDLFDLKEVLQDFCGDALAFVGSDGGLNRRVELQQRHHAGPHGHQVRTQPRGRTDRFHTGFNHPDGVPLTTGPAITGCQFFDVPGTVDLFILSQTGSDKFTAQVHAIRGATDGLALFVKHGLRLLAIVHRRSQIVFTQHQVQRACFFTDQNIAVRPDGTLGVIFHKGGFPEGRYTHAFLVRQHDGENTFADECGIFIATGDTGQYRINDTFTF